MNRNPLISHRMIYLSLALAATAEGFLIAAQILHQPRMPILFVLTLGWPFYYAICIGFAFGMAWVVKTGGFGDINPFSNILARFFPSLPLRRLRDWWLTLGVWFALFAIPACMALMSAVI